jgi:hypothetical protein
VSHRGTSVLSTAIDTVISIKPQSSSRTGRDQVDIGNKTKRNEQICAQFAIGDGKVNVQKNSAAHFAAEQFIIFIFSGLQGLRKVLYMNLST